MVLNQYYEEIKIMFPDEVKVFIRDHQEGDYTLLDVRQPGEYEETRLPGAKLVPLPQLADSYETLDASRPIIVYCQVGGRSRMATQLLMGLGFRDVFHMMGGIQAWEEQTASGPREFYLNFIRGDESPDKIIRMAYHMEEGLRKFHEAIHARTTDASLAALLIGLVKAEESHKKMLVALYESLEHDAAPDGVSRITDLPAKLEAGLMEGGIDFDEFMKQNEPFLNDVSGYLDLAMMIETQALDLYLRMADESTNERAKQVLFRIGNEEKAHLAMLGRYLDGIGELAGNGSPLTDSSGGI